MSDQQHDEQIQAFISYTGAPTAEAKQYLEAHQWNVEGAVDSWFQHKAENDDTEPEEVAQSTASAAPSGGITAGGRTLGGATAPAPAPASSSRSRQAAPSGRSRPRGGPVTLGDLSSGGDGHGHGHGHDEDNDDEHNNQDFFAGGEKSGLAVQNPGNPRDFVDRIFQRAQENAPRPGGEEEENNRPSHFGGRGVTLGGDDAPSQVIEDPNANQPRRLPRVTRVLHVWRNGFSIDDGPLRDPQADPENARILQMILNGHAPLHILNVEHGQEVDLDLDNQRDQDYVAPKQKYQAFSGSGQRLGESGPSVSTSTPSASASSAAPPAASATATPSSHPSSVTVDAAQPTLTLQIRLGDGTRLQSRFNTSHTIGDVYSFVNAASTASQGRSYVLSSTFPPKDFEDQGAVLGDLPEFKRGGVMVQKWK